MNKIACCIVPLMALSLTVAAQGSLTPPGAPEPGMKTLDEIYTRAEAAQAAAEAMQTRTPIASLPYTISSAGIYCLTGNLAGAQGITINADNVTLDLGGFSLTGDAGSGNGITSDSRRNIEVRNGTVTRWNFGVTLTAATHSRVTNINALNNNNDGVQVGTDFLVQEVWAIDNTYNGIWADRRCRVLKCTVKRNGLTGILTGGESEVSECAVELNQGAGIEVGFDSLARNNIALSNGQSGSGANIGASGNNSRIIGNQVKFGPMGLAAAGSGCVVQDNYVKGCADNYYFGAGNQLNLLICEIPETLDWPCSVKLAGSLTCVLAVTNGITVCANDVTIDLAGHALIGPGDNSGDGIYQRSFQNLTVYNGTVSNWRGPDKGGINAWGGYSRISGIQALENCCGISLGYHCLLNDCVASDNTYGGFFVGEGSIVRSCTAQHNGDYGTGVGFSIGSNCSVYDCISAYNRGCGVTLFSGCLITRCVVRFNDSVGIFANGSANRIDENTVTWNIHGIEVTGTGNIIVRNSSSGNYGDFVVAPGNSLGTVVLTPVGAGAWDNFSF